MHNFRARYGFARDDVWLGNWRERPFSRWSFQHVSEIVPSATIMGSRKERPKETPLANGLLDEKIRIGTATQTVKSFLEHSETDLFILLRDGKRIVDWCAPNAKACQPHIVFSISKSITGLLAGILQDTGEFDPNQKVSNILPEMRTSGYGDCTLQDLLDMRASIQFSEEYGDESGDYANYRLAMGWNVSPATEEAGGLVRFLERRIKGTGDHGGPFRYLSLNSDLLGLILERISGVPFAELMSMLLWQKLPHTADGFITVDRNGAPRTGGGISITARDLLAIGGLLLNLGAAGDLQIVSERWVHDMLQNGSSEAWSAGNYSDFIRGGRYRNQWYQFDDPDTVFMAIGIHGQWLYVDTNKRVLAVKLSSQALPQNDALDAKCLEFFARIRDLC